MATHIHVVVNPASGQERAPLEQMGALFTRHGATWDVSVTRRQEDAGPMAREAALAGADVVVACGGDGTVGRVAGGLLGTDACLAICPGGTANVIAASLGVSPDLEGSCALAARVDAVERRLDVGEIVTTRGSSFFLLQAGVGLHTSMVEAASRARKRRWGRLAYAMGLLDWLLDPPRLSFRLQTDDDRTTSPGAALLVCNSARTGMGPFELAPGVHMDDGLLDVLLLRELSLRAVLTIGWHALRRRRPPRAYLEHRTARTIELACDPPQPLQVDGCLAGRTPATIRLHSAALRALVPAPPAERLLRGTVRQPVGRPGGT